MTTAEESPAGSDEERVTKNPPVMGSLQRREVRSDLAVGVQTVLFDGAHDADNLDGFLGIEPQVFSDGVAVRPETLRKFFVNDYR